MKTRIFTSFLILLVAWILSDFLIPRKHDLKVFDPNRLGQLETAMWKSYYQHEPLKLFFQLSTTIRTQFHAPFWKSILMSYFAAKAALVFQKGQNRANYAAAFPFLKKYFTGICQLSSRPFNIEEASRNELEWWIIRREPQTHTTKDWEILLAKVAAELYHLPASKFNEHARLRVEAMIIRDEKGKNIIEEDWVVIGKLLQESWTALFRVVNEER